MTKIPLAIILLSLLATSAVAQHTITGIVVDASNNEPLAGANIYINRSQIGTVSQLDGTFTLEVPENQMTILFISFVGYKTVQQNLFRGKDLFLTVKLEEDQVNLSEYEVTTKPDKKWQRQLKRFHRLFIGNDQFARSCTILNPWVLEFKQEDRTFIASTDQVLKIKNEALGYLIAFKLNNFSLQDGHKAYDGLISFEELTSDDPEQSAIWRYNRRIAYGGSLRHFFKSVLDRKLQSNGFKARFLHTNMDNNTYSSADTAVAIPTSKISLAALFKTKKGKHYLDFKRAVRIYYYNDLKGERVQITDIVLQFPSAVDERGMLEIPAAVVSYGHLAKESFAYHLPREYDYYANEEALFQFNAEIVEPLESYAASHPTEQLHLHTDKNTYFSGEKVWFKAYANINNTPSYLSNKLYVQLFRKGESMAQVLVPLSNGVGHGSITLPEYLKEGSYLIKAYTNWTDTLEDAHHFYKNIQIGLSPTSVEGKKSPLSLRVFPSGGHIVSDVENKVAFELTDEQGQYINAPLELVDDNSRIIQTIYPTWQGKGSFTYIPKGKQSYTLRMTSNIAVSTSLTPSSDISTNMLIKEEGEFINVHVNSNKLRQESVHLLISGGDRIAGIRHVKVKDKKVISINKSSLIDGVNQLTLFDDRYQPIAERLYFKYPTAKTDIKLLMGSYSATNRGPSELVIRGEDNIRSASVSVSHADLFEENNQENIWISTYLRPHVTGNIVGLAPPIADDERLSRRLDLLMLVNGWRKYNWNKIRQQKLFQPDTISLPRGLDVEGILTQGNKRKPIGQELLYLIANDSDAALHQSYTDEAGRFTFKNIQYTDSTDLIFRVIGKSKSRTDLQIQFDSLQWNEHVGFKNYQIAAKSSAARKAIPPKQSQLLALSNSSGSDYVLQDPLASASSTAKKTYNVPRLFTAQDGQYLSMDNVAVGEKNNLFNLIETRFSGVRTLLIRTPAGGSRWTILVNRHVNAAPSKEVMVLVDNIPVDAEYLAKQINPQDIASMQLLNNSEAVMLGAAAINGAVVIYTRRNTAESLKKSPDFVQARLKGYQAYKSFYLPNHDSSADTAPDYRSTVYWQPNVDNDSRSLRYYNGDLTGRMRVVLEGFTTTGLPIRSVQYYNVERADQ